jgi:phage shock protein C
VTTTQRLMRSRNDKMIAGVAGGIARYLNVDAVIVRLVFVLLAISGPAFLFYPLLWILMPREPVTAGDPALGQVFVAEGTQTRRLRYDPMTGQPLEPEQDVPIQNINPDSSRSQTAQPNRQRLLGWILLGFGAFVALDLALPIVGPLLVPAILIAAGVYLLRRKS